MIVMKRVLRNPMENGSGKMPPKPMEKAKKGGPDQIQKQKRVLIVDDIPEILRSASRFLKKELETETANGGNEALEKLNAENFDAIVLDVNMPGMSGREVFMNLSAELQEKVVFFTAESKMYMEDLRLATGRPVINKYDAPGLVEEVKKISFK